MSLDVEGVVDRGVGGEEALGRRLGFEALLLSLSPSDRQVRVLSAVVFATAPRPVQMPEIQDIERRSV